MLLKSPYPEPPPTPGSNIHHFVFHRPEQVDWPDYTLYIDAKTGRKTTFRKFVSLVQLGATALGAPVEDGGLGLHNEDGEIVGIISPNCVEYIVLMHSLLAITTPFALVSSDIAFELDHLIKSSKCTRLFVHAQLLHKVLPVAKNAGIPSNRVYILEGMAEGWKSLSELIANARTKNIVPVSIRPATKETLAYLIFSSGTTGLPKAVMISHGNILYVLMQIAIVDRAIAEVTTHPPLKTEEGIPVGLGFLPLHHTYGLQFYSFRPFLKPSTIVLLSHWDIEIALKVIPKYRVSSLGLVPPVAHQLVNYPNISKVDLSSTVSVVCGGAYLFPGLAAKLSALMPSGTIVYEGFGMSECTNAATGQPCDGALNGRLKRVPGSTGVLLPGMEARIVRDDGTDADIDEVGELYLRGGIIALGYWGNEEATKKIFVDGWLRTGDKFHVDKEGNFFFVDRAKDTLKVSSMQVSPLEIENILLAHPKKLVIDVTVAGVSGGRMPGEKVPRAWVVLSDSGKMLGRDATIRELEAWHHEHLSKYKWLRGGIEVVNQIPKLRTGKVLRRVLQEEYEQRAGPELKGKL